MQIHLPGGSHCPKFLQNACQLSVLKIIARMQARLTALAEEAGTSGAAAETQAARGGVSMFTWRGGNYPVQAERIRTSLAAAAEVCCKCYLDCFQYGPMVHCRHLVAGKEAC